MRKRVIVSAIVLASAFVPFRSQAQAVAVGAGYALPRPIEVAPGQLIAIFVRVPGKTAASAVTAQPPLPTALAGFSVLLRQTFPSTPVPVPIQSAADQQYCSDVAPAQCDVVSMITVQIPFDLTPNVPHTTGPQNNARLEITYNGSTANSLLLSPVPDHIHILNSCDLINGLVPQSNCVPLLTRPDATVVDFEHPAAPGDTLSAAAVGLGLPGSDSVPGVWVSFDTRPIAAVAASSARARAGAVGIYDVSFDIPALPTGTAACGGDVRSNFTVTIGRTVSSDTAAFCVDPNASPVSTAPSRRVKVSK